MRQYTPGYIAGYRQQAVPQVQSTLAKLSLCRTAALDGHRYRCHSCDSETILYNSCGDRHCPQCAGAKRANWLASTAQLLLPRVDYFQVVFTLPDKLSSLALGNRKAIYDLLFHAAWQALREVTAEEQGFEAAALMVLHTWNQKLQPHAHVHALVPGGGPALADRNCWIKSQRPVGKRRYYRGKRVESGYLVEAEELRARFRKIFIKGLRRLRRDGELKLQGEFSHLQDAAEFDEWLKPLERITWVAYIEPPPSENADPEQVLKYLARYMTGGPISDNRLISHETGQVTFLARTGEKPVAGQRAKSEPYTLPGIEFVRRWSLHILPKGYTKSRRYGGYSNRHRERYLAECRRILSLPTRNTEQADEAKQPPNDQESTSESRVRCPRCREWMQRQSGDDRPSWRDIMSSSLRPSWYEDG